MQIKSIAECSKGAFCNTFDLYYATYLSLRSLFCLFLSGCFTQVLLYSNRRPFCNICTLYFKKKEIIKGNFYLGAYRFFLSVLPSLICVRSISPILFEVGIPNSMCGYTLGSRNVEYYFQVTVTLTLISGLNFRKKLSGAYLQYYLR